KSRDQGVRTGRDYLDAIKNDGRRVFLDSEEVRDVTTHPAFREGARTIAGLYDIAADPANRELMTFPSPATGKPVNRMWQIPKSVQDLRLRRGALERWSEESFGFMGRSPDHVAGFFVGFMASPEVLSRGGNEKYAQNCIRFYEFCRDNDIYVTYTIVPPQIDRSKPAHQQNPPDLYAGVVEERDGGIVIRGGQMLGTGSVYSDYILLSTIHPMKPGDENYAISVAIPANAPGVKIYPRRSYALNATSMFDYPLSTRFDETDSLLVYDNVFVPWEHVFIYKNLELCRAQWFETPAHIIGNNQSQIRFVTKLRFLLGLAHRVTKMNGALVQPAVQAQIAELAMYAATYEGLLDAQIETAKPNANGVFVPNPQAHYAAMNLQSWIYPLMLDSIRELSGGGMIQLPSNVSDLTNSAVGPDIKRYVQSPDFPAEERVKFLKLCWDAIGSEFGSRHHQYEKFYAGAPFIVKTHMFRHYDFKKSESLVDKALSGYSMSGREGGA
ncbi:MAG: 4-hydroxyphenylacetate 3-hydroxylase family protein, partial [Pseudorhodoplanes sp.]